MRIRKKKHLAERLEGVREILLVAKRDIPNVKLANLDKCYMDFNELFSNDNPVNLEIGCGKAGFIIECAKKNPNENYLAVELLENIIVMGAEKCLKDQVKNVRFFNCGAEYLPRYIKPNSISKIFLNFSPPYPAGTYENRRLTKTELILDYRDYLNDGGEILQKTDDKDFFEYSFNQFKANGFIVNDISNDIESGRIENIQTEYEKKFRKLNMPIYALSAKISRE